MVDGHLQQQSFDSEVIKLSGKLVDATIELHRHVMNNFLPSAVKFHYQFNLRELSSITQVGCTEYCIKSGHGCPLCCIWVLVLIMHNPWHSSLCPARGAEQQ